jgi:hypothetical protein
MEIKAAERVRLFLGKKLADWLHWATFQVTAEMVRHGW